MKEPDLHQEWGGSSLASDYIQNPQLPSPPGTHATVCGTVKSSVWEPADLGLRPQTVVCWGRGLRLRKSPDTVPLSAAPAKHPGLLTPAGLRAAEHLECLGHHRGTYCPTST
jgi:hypothetical protein